MIELLASLLTEDALLERELNSMFDMEQFPQVVVQEKCEFSSLDDRRAQEVFSDYLELNAAVCWEFPTFGLTGFDAVGNLQLRLEDAGWVIRNMPAYGVHQYISEDPLTCLHGLELTYTTKDAPATPDDLRSAQTGVVLFTASRSDLENCS